MDIAVLTTDPALQSAAEALRQSLALSPYQADSEYAFLLTLTTERLQLTSQNAPKSPIFVDFTSGKALHRMKFGGGRGQPLARAVGLIKGRSPRILDATAGLGRDAFVLATLGCSVHMVERSSIVASLLEDGLQRAQAYDNKEIADIAARLSITSGDACEVLLQLKPEDYPDVIYLDPMYPHRKKSAAVKKEMAILQQLLTDAGNNTLLLERALTVARKRVVVKRPKSAPTLTEQKPSATVESPNTRYDLYFT